MAVTIADIRAAARRLDLAGRPACVHCSLRSFGAVAGGADAILAGLAAEGCTVLVPAFTDAYLIPPPPGLRPARNGWDYGTDPGPPPAPGRVYDPGSRAIDRDMGALAAVVVARPGRCRGDHALNSFAAIGPLAPRLIAAQRPLDVHGPLRELAATGGSVVLMGVGPERLTLVHLAEALAGRRPFLRWANGRDGRPMMQQAGGCSAGFGKLGPVVARHAATTRVGPSRWAACPARGLLAALADEIRAHPELTRCGDPACGRCADALRGGPLPLDDGG